MHVLSKRGNTVKDKICITSRITSLIYLFSNNSQSVQTYLMSVPSACLANHSFSPLPFLGKSVGNTTCKLIFKMWFEGSLYKCDQSDYRKIQSCPILPHCYGPLRAVNGPYVLHKPSLLLTVRMLSTYGVCISLLHQGTMRYGSFDPYS